MHLENCVITLTYDDQHLPPGGTLIKKDFQVFMKSLRHKYVPKCPFEENTKERDKWLIKHQIRFYHCGEYGEVEEDINKPQTESRLGRPHYHACIFNHQFDDLEIFESKKSGDIYTSEKLSKIWGKGFVTVMNLTLQSAGYVARYITKKINGDKKDEHYQKVCEITGEIYPVLQEYSTQSNKPGIAKNWWNKYKKDVFPSDDVIVLSSNSYHHVPTPKYYDNQLEKEDPTLYEQIKVRRNEFAMDHIQDSTLRRLSEREICKKAQIINQKRKLI